MLLLSSAWAMEDGRNSVEKDSQLELPDLAPEREWAEVDAGKSFVSRPWHLRGSGQSKAVDTFWVELKIRPLAAEYGWQAVGMHLGTQQSEDVGVKVACRDFASIAGRRFCSGAPAIYSDGAHFMSFYGGLHAEIVEIATNQPRPLQFYVGAGASRVQAVALESQVTPYSSVEILYHLPSRITARASMFVSFLPDNTRLALSAPSLSLLYRF